MNKIPFLIIFSFFIAGCATTRNFYFTSEPSIERAVDILETTPEGRKLMRFIKKNPVTFEYAGTAGVCHHFSLKNPKTRVIFLPEEYKKSDKILAMGIARAAQIYKLYIQSNLDEIISEEEEIGMLFQARLGVAINVTTDDFAKVPEAYEMKHEFCSYVLENSKHALAQTRYIAQSSFPACQRPLENIVKQKIWLENMRAAINNDTFYQVLANRDRRRVRQGLITETQASGNLATLRAMPAYELTRYERTFYDEQKYHFNAFENLYNKYVKEDASWRSGNTKRINEIASDFAECDIEFLKNQKE